ncbi:TnsA endonuclease N terminal [Geoalkalibacter ferrihydriticus]|uniref:TnsA endonuclease N terminal n=1 Tax=Geoalkalibacter ferrihydriticus TaxID=392333 RepID=A0A1G9IG10_9BACT|nr:TnsA endonuclease N-terminal domain-containing protein [Geoalkalibacter ferrihydriticus]SDL24169.1 TnsA endonuclease N terminal [Geoalkalibacter ferrihydriticus]
MKKRRGISPNDVKRWIAKGDGQGTGREYKPFFHVRDVPSCGRSSMVLGLKTGRVHHYLSDLEYACHILAEYAGDITDIREQFTLLPWEETQRIADGLGIRHPTYPGTKTPTLITSDLVLTSEKEGQKSYGVICVKHSSATILPREANMFTSKFKKIGRRVRRVMEKLLIEKTYWELRGVSWRLVTEQDIPMVRVRNLDLLRGSMVSEELDSVNTLMGDFLKIFDSNWTANRTFLRILDRVGEKIGLSREECFTLFSRAVWLRLLPVDLDKKVIHHDQPLLRIANQGGDRC